MLFLICSPDKRVTYRGEVTGLRVVCLHWCRPLILFLSCFRSWVFALTNEWSCATAAKSSLLDNYSARIYRSFWACFRENDVYKFGHWNKLGSPSSSMVNDNFPLSNPESFIFSWVSSLKGPKHDIIFVAEFFFFTIQAYMCRKTWEVGN